jgi:hypothetical protein
VEAKVKENVFQNSFWALIKNGLFLRNEMILEFQNAQSVLLIGNAKRLCDTFVSVHATTKCKSDNKVEGLCQALE